MKKHMKGKAKVKAVMKEYGKGKLHSGSKKGPVVTSQKQAVAIALKQAGMSRQKTGITRKVGKALS